jgi:hypothetical protein
MRANTRAEEVSFTVESGSLGINCIPSPDSEVYKVQFGNFSGEGGNAETMVGGSLVPGMVLMRFNGLDLIGVPYEEGVEMLGARPCKLTFCEAGASLI